MTDQSALLLRKQLSGNILSWLDKANRSDVPSATDGGFFKATLSYVYAIYESAQEKNQATQWVNL